MKRTPLVACTSAGMLVGLLATASAYTVRPSTAPLVNFQGEQAGCVLSTTAPEPSATPFLAGDSVAGYTVECEHGWAVTQAAQRLVVIGPDGHRARVLVWNEGNREDSSPSADPVAYRGSHAFVPCSLSDADGWILPLGENTVLDGTNFVVGATELGTFGASVEQEVTVTCTEADHAVGLWPMSTHLRDDVAADSSCLLEVRRIQLRNWEPQWADGSGGWLHVPDYLTCPRPVGAYRFAFTMTQFDPDGSLGKPLRYGLATGEPHADGIVGRIGADTNPCLMRTDGRLYRPGESTLPFALPLGNHWLQIGAKVTIKTGKHLGHAWTGKAAQITQANCTARRRAYR